MPRSPLKAIFFLSIQLSDPVTHNKKGAAHVIHMATPVVRLLARILLSPGTGDNWSVR